MSNTWYSEASHVCQRRPFPTVHYCLKGQNRAGDLRYVPLQVNIKADPKDRHSALDLLRTSSIRVTTLVLCLVS